MLENVAEASFLRTLWFSHPRKLELSTLKLLVAGHETTTEETPLIILNVLRFSTQGVSQGVVAKGV